jgi:pimeloyl-ACP methyl ester carboxylesterase
MRRLARAESIGSDAPHDAWTSYDDRMVASASMLSFDCGQVTLTAEGFGNAADPPVLLFHGGGQTRHSWDRTAAELGGNGWYAVNVDLRGHGRSGWSPDGDYSVDRFRDDVWAVARSFDRLPVMVGASLGGVCSLLAIGESDVPVASALVLVDVAPRIERVGAMRIGARATSRVSQKICVSVTGAGTGTGTRRSLRQSTA